MSSIFSQYVKPSIELEKGSKAAAFDDLSVFVSYLPVGSGWGY